MTSNDDMPEEVFLRVHNGNIQLSDDGDPIAFSFTRTDTLNQQAATPAPVELTTERKITRHHQVVEHRPSEGLWGDCYRTCIASILNTESPEDVPHFADNGVYDSNDTARAWLRDRGYELVTVPYGLESVSDLLEIAEAYFPDVPFIVTARGPRGVNHCAIYTHKGLLHDPAPTDEGVIRPDEETGFFWCDFILRRADFQPPVEPPSDHDAVRELRQRVVHLERLLSAALTLCSDAETLSEMIRGYYGYSYPTLENEDIAALARLEGE